MKYLYARLEGPGVLRLVIAGLVSEPSTGSGSTISGIFRKPSSDLCWSYSRERFDSATQAPMTMATVRVAAVPVMMRSCFFNEFVQVLVDPEMAVPTGARDRDN